jgi:hypothetical protein
MSTDANIPDNNEAETIERLKQVNVDIDAQILELAKAQASNAIIIETLRPLAKWKSVDDLIISQAQGEI